MTVVLERKWTAFHLFHSNDPISHSPSPGAITGNFFFIKKKNCKAFCRSSLNDFI